MIIEFAFSALQAVPSPQAVTTTVQALTDFVLRYVVALAGVGAFSMALVETVKVLVDARTWYQTRRWIKWMAAMMPAQRGEPASGPAAALAELLEISAGMAKADARSAAAALVAGQGWRSGFFGWRRSGAHALFALTLPKMMGCVQDAADAAMGDPERYPALYRFMVDGADPDDTASWRQTARSLVPLAEGPLNAAERQAAKDRADNYARLKQLVKRKLDAFQLNTDDRWVTWNQLVANAAGAVTLAAVLFYIRATSAQAAYKSMGTGMILLLSLLGGILAPVAKDLVSTLKRVKNG